MRAALEQVLGSRAFLTSERLRRFLRYVVEETLAGRAGLLKEYSVATEVCGRGADFDPRIDPVVRVEARRLRARLADYYGEEGAEDRVVFQLPKGGYVPVVEFRQPEAALADTEDAEPETPAGTLPTDDGGPAPREPDAVRPRGAGRPWHRRGLAAGALALMAVAVAAFYVLRPLHLPSNGVAVLPFQNASAEADNEHFCFGLVEDLTAVLAEVPGLRVVARTSAEQFRGGQDLAEVSRRLRVRYVVEGSVRREANRLRVTARLVDTQDGSPIWASTYDRDLESVFAVQGELAHAIGEALVPRLGLAGAGIRPRREPLSSEAYALFLRGQFLFRTQPDGHAKAIEYLDAAIAKDPTYAPAHLELAAIRATTALDQLAPPQDQVALARQGVERALALDPTLADALALKGWLQFFNDWDWAGSEALFKEALQLNPASASAHHRYALVLMTAGRFDEAVAHIRQAKDLDPLSYRLGTGAAVVYFCARRYREAEREARDAITLARGFYLGHLLLGSTLAAQGRYDAAITAYRDALGAIAHEPDALSSLGRALALAGRTAEARSILARLEAPDAPLPPSHYELAFLLAALGERDLAFAKLDRALARHETELVYVAVDPLFDPLHADPRWAELLRKVGVPRPR